MITYNGRYQYRRVLAQAPTVSPISTEEAKEEPSNNVPLLLLGLAALGTAVFIWAASSTLAKNGR